MWNHRSWVKKFARSLEAYILWCGGCSWTEFPPGNFPSTAGLIFGLNWRWSNFRPFLYDTHIISVGYLTVPSPHRRFPLITIKPQWTESPSQQVPSIFSGSCGWNPLWSSFAPPPREIYSDRIPSRVLHLPGLQLARYIQRQANPGL